MVLENKTFNNLVNFVSSYLLNTTLQSEELINEFALFSFNMDKQTIMMLVGATMIAGKNDPISNEIIITRKDLSNKLREFLDYKKLDHNIDIDLDILLDDDVKSISQIQRKYSIGFVRASKIYNLYKSLM